ncbi:MAG TPA: cysteine peptidase family C39 domain-containing protein [Methanobacterium sp.]|nr:cysteine peptidase family C39 domain-containing protein [Methanobacterium sp.]
MKTLKIVLMLALAIVVASVFAGAVSAAGQTSDPVIAKEENNDFGAVHQTIKQNESGNVSKMDLNAAAKPEAAVNVENSTILGQLAETNNVSIMQSTNYTCGPAALATVLNNLGINTTEQELVSLAGTDESGTTMYGLVQAAQVKGLKATGMKLFINELKKNDIVFLNTAEAAHYSVVKEVTNESVKLSDPSLGNIEMSREGFEKVYSENVLVIINPNALIVNLSSSTENGTSKSSTDLRVGKTLENDEMQSIKGKDWIDDAKRFVGGVIEPIAKLFRPSASADLNYTKNNTTTHIQMHVQVQAASKYKKSKKK